MTDDERTDQEIRDLIERSSLGTPEAKRLRASVAQDEVDRIMARLKEAEVND